ncbi:2366_t:CDS:2, partial [Racocetra persica]
LYRMEEFFCYSMNKKKSNSIHHIKWFEKIKDGIVEPEFSAFKNKKQIGGGGFGIVHYAEYNGKKVALKSLNNDDMNKEVSKEFIKE